jgi:hypothetical protein
MDCHVNILFTFFSPFFHFVALGFVATFPYAYLRKKKDWKKSVKRSLKYGN